MLPTPLTDTSRGRMPTRIAPRPWRPRPSLLVVGLVLVLASVVGVGALIHSVSGEHGILVMARTVQAGQVITAGDLEVVNVSQDMGGLTVINSSEEDAVVGRPAATTLYNGTPLVVAELGPVQLPSGDSVMAVNAKLGSYPPSIAAGDEVEVIDDQTASTSTSSAAPVVTGPVERGGRCRRRRWMASSRCSCPPIRRRRWRRQRRAATWSCCWFPAGGAESVALLPLCSVKGAPGVTTAACALGAVWPRAAPHADRRRVRSGGR